MPVVIPKPPPKPVDTAPKSATPVAVPAGITLADVQAMLDARDAVWERRLQAVEAAFASAMAERQPQRAGASIKFRHDLKGLIVGADITPKA